jgi:hypothetical protein
VPDAAPRYDPRLLDAVEVLDDDSQPMAETCRRVAAYAEALGLSRPSYSHLRGFVLELRVEREQERARKQAVRRALRDAGITLATGRMPDAYGLAERVERETARRS